MSQATLDPRTASEAPVSAFRFHNPLKLAAMDATAESTTSRPITLLARTNSVLNHWYWGRCIHDFSGMEHKERIVLDYCHDDDELIGYADQFDIGGDGLSLSGRIESIEPMDAANRFILQSDKGIPFEASIFFDEAILEFVPEGYSTEVNGKTEEGPLTVFRKWLLRACSVCPYGYDSDTVASLEADKKTALKWMNQMTTATATTPATQPAVDPRDELRQFTDKFGAADGCDYFGRKLSFADASLEHIGKLTERHASELKATNDRHTEAITKLTAERETITKERDEAVAKLNAAKLTLGEQTAVDTGKTPSTQPKKSFAQFIKAK
jgi:hypothetical protein